MPVAPMTDWKQFVRGKWLFWDTSAVIRVIHYQAEDIFIELEKLSVTNCYISPVELELLATQNNADQIKRLAVLARHLELFPFTASDLDRARRIQLAIGSISQPSPTDLYLAATLVGQNPKLVSIITENIRDFPAPYFARECYVTLQNDKTSCSLAFLSSDGRRFV